MSRLSPFVGHCVNTGLVLLQYATCHHLVSRVQWCGHDVLIPTTSADVPVQKQITFKTGVVTWNCILDIALNTEHLSSGKWQTAAVDLWLFHLDKACLQDIQQRCQRLISIQSCKWLASVPEASEGCLKLTCCGCSINSQTLDKPLYSAMIVAVLFGYQPFDS